MHRLLPTELKETLYITDPGIETKAFQQTGLLFKGILEYLFTSGA